jgi:NDP-sugar pyrophosphorylase family protein
MEKQLFSLQLRRCSAHGFDDIIINVHHFADMVEDEVRNLTKLDS